MTISDVRFLASELTDRAKTLYLFNIAIAFPGESRLHVLRKYHPKLCRLVKQPVLLELIPSTHQCGLLWLLRSAVNDVPICNVSEAGTITVDRKKVEFFAKKRYKQLWAVKLAEHGVLLAVVI